MEKIANKQQQVLRNVEEQKKIYNRVIGRTEAIIATMPAGPEKSKKQAELRAYKERLRYYDDIIKLCKLK